MSLANKLKTDLAFYDDQIKRLDAEKGRLVALRDQIEKTLRAHEPPPPRPQSNGPAGSASERFPQVNQRYATLLEVCHEIEAAMERREIIAPVSRDEIALRIREKRPTSNASARSVASDMWYLRKNHADLLPEIFRAGRGRG